MKRITYSYKPTILIIITIMMMAFNAGAKVLPYNPDTLAADKPGVDNSADKTYRPFKSEVLKIITALDSKKSKSDNGLIQADQIIRITISHPKDFLLQRPNDNSKLILYADGIPLKGMQSSYFSELSIQDVNDATKIWPDSLEIPFLFKKDSTNKEAWNSLFRMASWNQNRISFKLSAGWSGMFPLNYAKGLKPNTKLTLFFYEPKVFYILLFLYVCFICVFIVVCHKTGLIRDPDEINHTHGPYSLAQTQLAFWTVIVIGGFIYLILLTGLSDSLNDSILMLLGISGGTTGVAGFIDYYKKRGDNPASSSATPGPAVASKVHQSFLKDILSDGTNVSVQRTQVALWNAVLGIYFMWYVVNNKSMPVFDNTLLILAGVSSVLYLTSKGPENTVKAKDLPFTPPPPAADPANGEGSTDNSANNAASP